MEGYSCLSDVCMGRVELIAWLFAIQVRGRLLWCLLADSSFIVYICLFRVNESAEVAPAGLDASSAKALLEETNPFLAHLLSRYLPDDPVAAKSAKNLADDLSETEKALRNKMKDTMAVASSILNAIEEMKGAGNGGGSLPGFEESKLAALVNILKSENGKLVKDSLSDSIAIRQLEADIADKEAEIQVLHRKLVMEKSVDRGGGDVGVSRSEEAPEVSKGVSRNGSEQKLVLDQKDEAAPQVEALKKEVEKRDGDIARLERYVFLAKCLKSSAEVWRANPLR